MAARAGHLAGFALDAERVRRAVVVAVEKRTGESSIEEQLLTEQRSLGIVGLGVRGIGFRSRQLRGRKRVQRGERGIAENRIRIGIFGDTGVGLGHHPRRIDTGPRVIARASSPREDVGAVLPQPTTASRDATPAIVNDARRRIAMITRQYSRILRWR